MQGLVSDIDRIYALEYSYWCIRLVDKYDGICSPSSCWTPDMRRMSTSTSGPHQKLGSTVVGGQSMFNISCISFESTHTPTCTPSHQRTIWSTSLAIIQRQPPGNFVLYCATGAQSALYLNLSFLFWNDLAFETNSFIHYSHFHIVTSSMASIIQHTHLVAWTVDTQKNTAATPNCIISSLKHYPKSFSLSLSLSHARSTYMNRFCSPPIIHAGRYYLYNILV